MRGIDRISKSGSFVGERSGARVDLSGLEVIEDLVYGLLLCDDGDDLHFRVACGASESWPDPLDIIRFEDYTLAENTVISNTAWHGGGIFCDQSTEVDVSNTIFWGNTASLGSQIYMGALEYARRNTLTIDYSNVEGGEASVFMGEWDVLNWGEHIMDTIPDFSGDGYHLNSYSPLRNAGDPNYSVPGETDIDGEPRVLEGRIDIGADEIKAMHIQDGNPPAADHIREAKTLE